MQRVILVALCLGMALGIAGNSQARAAGLRAAAGKVDITPTGHVFMAGYGSNRVSEGAHDSLMARCLVLENGGTRIAFVACDVIGMPRYRIEKIRARVTSIRPENLFIAATHTHSGPDTLGQWGPDIRTSGVDTVWITSVQERIAKLVDETSAKLQPATLKFAHTTKVPRVSKNIRVKAILDTELGVMQAVAENGKPIATFVNYACHPEILNNHQLSADFPHWLYDTVESKTGAVCLYLNGAQGGMVTADYDEEAEPKGKAWKAAETIGTDLGNRVLEILESAETTSDTKIEAQRRVFLVPLENDRFKALIALKVFPGGMLKNGSVETEVARIVIGSAEFLTLPGEVLPNIGLYLKHLMRGQVKFLLGLTGDELGYILTPEDFFLDLYAYESSVSVGPQMEPLMVQNLRALLPPAPTSVSRQ